MKRCGGLTAKATAILSWSISEKFGQSWLLVRFIAILIQFGDVVIGGTLEKYGINVTIRREMGRDIDGACGQLRKRYMAGVGTSMEE